MLARVVADGQEQCDLLLHVLQLDVHDKVDDVLLRPVVAHRVDVEVLLVLTCCGRVDVAVAGDWGKGDYMRPKRADILGIPVLLLRLLQLLSLTPLVLGHGRLMEPPARNAMWRFGFPNAVNYNDNELFCGGYAVQWEQNQGQCGVCGDAYHLRDPKPHEAGGEYGRGIISRRYFAGQEIDVEIELTANHMGRFELFLCPNNNKYYEATQECFDRYPLYLSGTSEVRYSIPPESGKKDIFRYRVRLPPYVTCTQCVMQWTYFTGNMWGRCDIGTEGR
ncbi:conserved hypothetical protein [Culex quinquefasciatus]|uniref:Chitin-binding type-4 domain-containing protein n=1 Tax=Culex quinquefasciatus TaxID=7176 RepID=B0XBP7_CULQU|nr:conserved hypothetical protein [Culex quinquefasciatus]|eukprot:XP_001867069.1 conserved hypothetical protein [Culex quinquefasciatus]